MKLFWDDLRSVVFAFPIVFFVGLIWICIYIVHLAGHIDDKNLHHADRFDWLYRIVFSVTVIAIVVRTVFIQIFPPWPIVTICIISGVLALITPKIVDNNNDEF